MGSFETIVISLLAAGLGVVIFLFGFQRAEVMRSEGSALRSLTVSAAWHRWGFLKGKGAGGGLHAVHF